MTCSCCHHEILTRTAYFLARVTDHNQEAATFCAICWAQIVTDRRARQLSLYMRVVARQTPMRWVQDALGI
jgi:hypothetical protein